MKTHKQNPLFNFQIAERRLTMFGAENPSNGEVNPKKPDPQKEMDGLKDKALKTIDKLGRLIDAINIKIENRKQRIDNLLKRGGKTNKEKSNRVKTRQARAQKLQKKLQDLHKNLQEHIQNVESGKGKMQAAVIENTINSLNSLINNKQERLLKTNLRATIGDRQKGLIRQVKDNLRLGGDLVYAKPLVSLFSLMKNGTRGINRPTEDQFKRNGEYNKAAHRMAIRDWKKNCKGAVTKKGDQLTIKMPNGKAVEFKFKLVGKEWKIDMKKDGEWRPLHGEDQSGVLYEGKFTRDNIKVKEHSYEEAPEKDEKNKGGISVLNMKYINQSNNKITFKNISNKVTINHVLDSSKQQLVLIKKGIPQVITSTKKGWVNLSTKGKDKRPRIDNGNQVVEVTDNKQHLQGTDYYVEKGEDGKLKIQKIAKNIPTEVHIPKVTKQETKKRSIPTAARRVKPTEYKRSKEESALLNENKEKPVDNELNETVSDNAKKVYEMLSQGYLTYVRPMIKAMQKLKTPEPSFKEAAKPVRKLIQRTKTLYQKTKEDTPIKDTIANLKKVKNTVPKEIQKMPPMDLLEKGIDPKHLGESNTEKPKTPIKPQENQENENVALRNTARETFAKLNVLYNKLGVGSEKINIRKLRKLKSWSALQKLAKGKNYQIQNINELSGDSLANWTKNAIANRSMKDNVTLLKAEMQVWKDYEKSNYKDSGIDVKIPKNIKVKNIDVKIPKINIQKQKPSQQAKTVMKLVNQNPVDEKALEKELRKIAKNPKFTENTSTPMRLGNSGYYLSKTNNGNVRVELKDGNDYKLTFLAKNGEQGLYSYNPLKSIGTGLI